MAVLSYLRPAERPFPLPRLPCWQTLCSFELVRQEWYSGRERIAAAAAKWFHGRLHPMRTMLPGRYWNSLEVK